MILLSRLELMCCYQPDQFENHGLDRSQVVLHCIGIGASATVVPVHCVSKKCTNFETVLLRIVEIDFDDFWQKYSKVSRIEFACFSFHVGLLFINFSSFKLDAEK